MPVTADPIAVLARSGSLIPAGWCAYVEGTDDL